MRNARLSLFWSCHKRKELSFMEKSMHAYLPGAEPTAFQSALALRQEIVDRALAGYRRAVFLRRGTFVLLAVSGALQACLLLWPTAANDWLRDKNGLVSFLLFVLSMYAVGIVWDCKAKVDQATAQFEDHQRYCPRNDGAS
jgi:hypothetical protein